MSKIQQLSFFGDDNHFKREQNVERNQKLRWQRQFQEYSDKMSQDSSTPSGKCGYMDFCDCCTDNSYGRPCVRAFGEWARKNNIQVDYNDFDFSKWI